MKPGSSSMSSVCVIGAGPSGISALMRLNEAFKNNNHDVGSFHIVCYEKQSDWGGLWNFDERTGTDERGDLIHGSMYRFLWSNNPKETVEFPEYTFDDHFGGAVPSFLPREQMRDYLTAFWSRSDVKKLVEFQHAVRSVKYDGEADKFDVVVEDLATGTVHSPRTYTHVIVATGHFSTPQVPSFSGLDAFPGRVLHSHDFRDAREFQGQRVLIVGASYSAEDIALQCAKFGASNVTLSWRSRPLGFKWPDNVEERPLVKSFSGHRVEFVDGSFWDVDAVILATGYAHSYPFLAENLRLKTNNRMWISKLYKGALFLGGGGGKLFYLGAQNQAYSFTLFDQLALFTANVITGVLPLPPVKEMAEDERKWDEREAACADVWELVQFQTDHVQDLTRENSYSYDLNAQTLFEAWIKSKIHNIVEYRNETYVSLFTGTRSTKPKTPFMQAFEENDDILNDGSQTKPLNKSA